MHVEAEIHCKWMQQQIRMRQYIFTLNNQPIEFQGREKKNRSHILGVEII